MAAFNKLVLSSTRRLQIFVAAFILGLGNVSASAMSALQIGTLTCDVSQGIDTVVVCDFHSDGHTEAYVGTIGKLSSNLGGASEEVHLAWAVLTKASTAQAGDLTGDYDSVASGTLIGGYKRAFSLHPVSVAGAPGWNLADRVLKFSLVTSN